MAEEHNEEQQMLINHEYKLWKKNSAYNYDLAILHAVEWPSTTWQWLPDMEVDEDGFENHYAILSANSSEPDQSELQKVKVIIPPSSKEKQFIEKEEQKVQVVERKTLGSEINRARYCYGNASIVASTHATGELLLTDKGELCNRLVAHTAEGYGLSWNPNSHSLLASGHTDKRICIWDVMKNKQESNKIVPVIEILHHNTPVEDVAWHRMHPNIFASCSDDRLIMIWDMRFRSAGSNNECKPMFEIIGHTNQVYSLDFSPFNQFLFLSGSGDESASVWDMRNLTRSISTFKGDKSIIKVQWSPFIGSMFATCGYDHTVNLWDLGLDRKDPSQKRLFVHKGHRSKVVDFDWNPHNRFLLGSTEENNCIHIWEMMRSIYFDEQKTVQ